MSGGTGFRKPCLECGLPGEPGAPRCPDHTKVWNGMRSREKLARRGPTPNAQKLRYVLSKGEYSTCTSCRGSFGVWDMEVDHIKALGDGGTDHVHNLQVLCRSCHTSKTLQENRQRRKKI